MSADKFSFYDFFVNIVPGTVALLIFISLLPAQYDAMSIVSDVSLLSGSAFLILSYILGHLVQSIASPVDSWWMTKSFQFWIMNKEDRLYPFENLLTKARENDNYVVARRFIECKDDFFEDNLTGGELFLATHSYLWNHNIGRMRRFQVLYTLFRSLWVLFLFGTGFYLVVFLVQWQEWYETVWTYKELLIIIVLLGISTVLAYLRRVKFHKKMAKTMIFDFYANVLSQND